MTNLEKYNFIRDAIVIKVEIESSVKVDDVGELYHQITRKEFPDVTLEIIHTNYELYEIIGCKNILVKFAGTMNPNDLLPLVMPGGIIAEVVPIKKALKVVNRDGKHGLIKCEEIMFKALK